jgi:predicted metal-dependent peptidase
MVANPGSLVWSIIVIKAPLTSSIAEYKQREQHMEEENTTDATLALGIAIQWACSPRGGNNFYGRVLNGCSRQIREGWGTCGVTLDKRGRYIFLWDPAWFIKQAKSFQLLVMVHEAAHLVLRHPERTLWLFRNYDLRVKLRLTDIRQIAADMAVNDTAVRPLIGDKRKKFEEHRKKFIWPESMKFPVGKTYDDYFLLLLDELQKNGWSVHPKECTCKAGVPVPMDGAGVPSPGDTDSDSQDGESSNGTPDENEDDDNRDGNSKPQPGSGGSPGNPHGYPQFFLDLLAQQHPPVSWDAAFGDASQGQIERAVRRAKREAQHIVRRAVHQTQKSQGLIPGNLSAEIEELLAEPTIPWSVVLFGLVKSEISYKLDESTAYPHVGLLHDDNFEPFPGYQNDYTFNIVAMFDTSGSMANSEVAEAYSELCGVLDTEDGTSVRLIHFDAVIQHEEILSSDSTPKLRQGTITRHGHGGTNFEPPLRYALHQDTETDWVDGAERADEPLGVVDLILLFTDGEASIPFPKLEPDIPFFWVITTQGQEKPEMKRVLHIT